MFVCVFSSGIRDCGLRFVRIHPIFTDPDPLSDLFKNYKSGCFVSQRSSAGVNIKKSGSIKNYVDPIPQYWLAGILLEAEPKHFDLSFFVDAHGFGCQARKFLKYKCETIENTAYEQRS